RKYNSVGKFRPILFHPVVDVASGNRSWHFAIQQNNVEVARLQLSNRNLTVVSRDNTGSGATQNFPLELQDWLFIINQQNAALEPIIASLRTTILGTFLLGSGDGQQDTENGSAGGMIDRQHLPAMLFRDAIADT